MNATNDSCNSVRWIPCVLLALLAACAGTNHPNHVGTRPPTSVATSADRADQKTPQRPAAIYEGTSISREDLRPRLMEMSGGQILDELILEHELAQALAAHAIVISPAAIHAEEETALEALSADPSRREQLLHSLRAAQGLGPTRWQALLFRNAALRALAREASEISEENIRQAYDSLHGPRRSCRLIVVADLAAAERVQARLDSGESFSEVAAMASTDSSASRGGLLAPIARLDPSYPPAVREMLFALAPGGRSEFLLLENGYAIIEMRSEVAGNGADPATVRAECERVARRAQERVEMDRIARGLLRGVNATIFDRSLDESWKRQLESHRE
ncbi:MAG: peptidylprolyl isomerase [Phycisphaerales bacterium]|nr:peptidylprolyl isomerase [Phycisphaerales bacterium]